MRSSHRLTSMSGDKDLVQLRAHGNDYDPLKDPNLPMHEKGGARGGATDAEVESGEVNDYEDS